jgi:uracil-DNA glycosylase
MLIYNMRMDTRITTLVAALAALPTPEHTTNPYASHGPPGNALRCANLTLALHLALERGPDLLLVGEAPGYNGALRTGVPFTSERILLTGIPALQQFGSIQGFQCATTDGRVSNEPTATIVYRELAALGRFAVGWNTYPLHPHRPGNPLSNRPPRSSEIRLGLPLLAAVRELFPTIPVAAMGNVAARALGELGIPFTHLRHPAQGGARRFAHGLQALFAPPSN